MRDLADFDDMPGTRAVAEFMNHEEWQDEISIEEDRSHSRVATVISIKDQPFNLYIETSETLEVIEVYLYSPFFVPVTRILAMTRVLNRINFEMLQVGRFAIPDNSKPCKIQFRAEIIFEGGCISRTQVMKLVSQCFKIFQYHDLLSNLASSETPEDELWNKFMIESD